MGDLGLPEIILILVVVLLLFGPGRIGKVAGELGEGIRNFRKGLQEEEKPKEENKEVEEADDKNK